MGDGFVKDLLVRATGGVKRKVCRHRRRGKGRREPVREGVNAEHLAARAHAYGRTVGLSVGRITGDVGRGKERVAEQRAVNVGFAFPRIEDESRKSAALHSVTQGRAVGDRSAGGVDEGGTATHPVEETSVG